MDEGTPVEVTVGDERRAGTVLDRSYTPRQGTALVAVSLAEPLPDGRERAVVPADAVSPSA